MSKIRSSHPFISEQYVAICNYFNCYQYNLYEKLKKNIVINKMYNLKTLLLNKKYENHDILQQFFFIYKFI